MLFLKLTQFKTHEHEHPNQNMKSCVNENQNAQLLLARYSPSIRDGVLRSGMLLYLHLILK